MEVKMKMTIVNTKFLELVRAGNKSDQLVTIILY